MKHYIKADLIAGLNEDLAHEYASVMQYQTYASTIRGPHRPMLRPLFVAEVADELRHAGALADAIVALGGTPTTTPASVPAAESAEDMLRAVLEAEEGALARYLDRRRQAETLGEIGLAVALDEMIADETRHRDEIRLVLDGWAEAAAVEHQLAGVAR
jgi:bacterioferritin